jgi:internalin A
MAMPSAIPTSKAVPDRARFLDPFDDSILLAYFRDVCNWHGFVRFLGLPHLEENPDQSLAELYVEPFLSRTALHPDQSPEEWASAVQPALAAVAEAPRLIVLGDPGSGKSTLVSWIAWQLSQPHPNPWRQRLGPLVPFPMVLRELKLDAGLTWKRLVEAFLAHPVAENLRTGKRAEDLLDRGQAFLLLDGLDEIGSLEIRKALRQAVFEGAGKYPGCKFLLTSRVVGYEEVSFDSTVRLNPEMPLAPGEEKSWGERLYVAPFSDEQIQQFARNWYSRREAAAALRETGASDLVAAIHGSESTLRLARNPNLLTLMALIHRVQRRLPHGRALLFEKIAEAYLESIDLFRGIHEVDYPLVQKKRWLGYVGFQMQLQRSKASEEEEGPERREVLVDHETVCRWILDAMASSAHETDPAAARKFVDYIGRRSGLLLPRGEGVFAFTHLSFQEYFAAYHLSEQVTSPRWLSGKSPDGTRPQDLRGYANQTLWRETFVLLFELLAERREWLEELKDRIFGHELESVLAPLDPSQEARVELLAAVSVDPYSGFSKRERALAWSVCWTWQLKGQKEREEIWRRMAVVAQRLSAAQRDDQQGVWEAFRRVASELKPTRLDLSGAPVSDLSPLSGLTSLQDLDLSGAPVSDLSPLSGLTSLQDLGLSGAPVSDLSPLSGLASLRDLYLGGTPVSDLSPLSGLSSLRSLSLSGSPVSDLSPLSGLASLQSLSLSGAPVSDLSPLSGLASLHSLDLSGAPVSDLSPLSGLASLKGLDLSGAPVSESGIQALRRALPSLTIFR